MTVSVMGDALNESNETVVVKLSAPTGATVTEDRGVVKTTDDD